MFPLAWCGRLVLPARGGQGAASRPRGDRALRGRRRVRAALSHLRCGERSFLRHPHRPRRSENHTLRYCRLNGYVYENADTGAFFQIDSKTGDAGVSCHWYRMTSRASAGQAATVSYTPVLLPLFLDFWDISAFPRTEAAFYEAEGDVLPDGLGVVTGVRLRRETSTRSDILGDSSAA